MRHPNIIGLYAWCLEPGTIPQIGMVLEVADGDLRQLYMDKIEGRPFSYKVGIEVAIGVAKGLAYMHSMPSPVMHRDIKSKNIMVSMVENVMTGKVGDCGESRRVVSVLVVWMLLFFFLFLLL